MPRGRNRMSNQYTENDGLEWLDALEIGVDLTAYQEDDECEA